MKYHNLVEKAELMIAEQAEPALVNALTNVFSDAFVFYFKAHAFHWNVVGKDFPQYHEFFSKVYEGVFGQMDRLAEQIRALGVMAPMNLASVIGNSSLTENKDNLDVMEMVSALAADNNKILAGLLACAKLAEAADEPGLENYLTELFDQHKKLAWMFNAILKG